MTIDAKHEEAPKAFRLQTKCTWCSPSPLYPPHPAPACAVEPRANQKPPPDPVSVAKLIWLAGERGGCWEEPDLCVYTWIRQSRRAERAAAMQTCSSQRHALSARHRCSPWQLELPVLGWALWCHHIMSCGPLDCCGTGELGQSGPEHRACLQHVHRPQGASVLFKLHLVLKCQTSVTCSLCRGCMFR